VVLSDWLLTSALNLFGQMLVIAPQIHGVTFGVIFLGNGVILWTFSDVL